MLKEKTGYHSKRVIKKKPFDLFKMKIAWLQKRKTLRRLYTGEETRK